MGNKQSASSVKTSVTDIVNKNMFNSFTRNLNEQSSNCTGDQYAEILIGPGAEVNCGVTGSQKMALSCKAQAYFASQNENSLKNDIKNSLDQSFKSDQKQENPSLTLVPYSQQNSSDRVNVQNYMKNIVEKNLTSENLNKCLAMAKGAQTGKITILGKVNCPPGKSVSMDQELLLEQYAQCGSDIINKTLSEDKFINDIATTASSSQSNLTSGYGAIVGMVIILIIVCIGAYFLFKRSPAGMAQSISKMENITPDQSELIKLALSKKKKE